MSGQQLVNSLDRFLKVILQMAWLNFLWFLFTLLGLVVFGIFPAITAIISVSRKWIWDEKMNSIFRTFKATYRKEFKRSNLIGFYLVTAIILLAVNYYALLELGVQVPIFIVFAYYFVIFIFNILFVWLFPLVSHYDAKIILHFKNALIIGLTRIPTSISMITSVFIILYVSLKLPSLFLFFSMSLIALSIAFLTGRVFKEIDKSNEKTNIRTTQDREQVL